MRRDPAWRKMQELSKDPNAMLGGALMVYHEEKPNKAENPGIAMLGGALMVLRNNPTRQKILESACWEEP